MLPVAPAWTAWKGRRGTETSGQWRQRRGKEARKRKKAHDYMDAHWTAMLLLHRHRQQHQRQPSRQLPRLRFAQRSLLASACIRRAARQDEIPGQHPLNCPLSLTLTLCRRPEGMWRTGRRELWQEAVQEEVRHTETDIPPPPLAAPPAAEPRVAPPLHQEPGVSASRSPAISFSE